MRKPFFFSIDVVGRCNLACPSCPQGNQADRLERQFMTLGLLSQILSKAEREVVVFGVGLFNWGEPFLHPSLAGLVRVVNNYEKLCYLSSNFNLVPNLSEVIAAEPHSLRISCSGFSQQTYERTHRGGNIDKVKANMEYLGKMRRTTRVHVLWHNYRHNQHEREQMKAFTEGLGFEFRQVEAYHMPLESVLRVWDGREPAPAMEHLLLTSLAEHKTLCADRTTEACRNQTQEITIDASGNVQLCCGVYDPNAFNLGSYLLQSIETIQAKRFAHSFCDKCIKAGGHVYVSGLSRGPEPLARRMSKTAFAAVAPLVPRAVLKQIL